MAADFAWAEFKLFLASADDGKKNKSPPVAPVLLTKIRNADPKDWARTPDDLRGLLAWISTEMNVNFGSNIKSFGEMSYSPTENWTPPVTRKPL